MDKARKNGQRIFILTIVIAFLLSSLGFTGLVVWQMTLGKQDDSQTADIQKQLEEQMKNQNQNKLEGTKLQDFKPLVSVNSLQKIDLKAGKGAVVKPGDKVVVNYTGALATTGVVFQSSLDSGQPVPLDLKGGTIKGWQEGVPGMKVGGKRRLIIPADLAYGANPPQGSGIPANAPLVFDVELVKIGQ